METALFKPYKGIILDLDDTLYREKEYLFPAYRTIADYIEKEFDKPAAEVYDFLRNTFTEQGRARLFNRLADRFSLPETIVLVCISKLREVKLETELKLFEEMTVLMKKLYKQGKKLFVLTNGNPVQQRNKVAQIQWGDLKEKIYFFYAAEHEAKPSASAVKHILEQFSFSKEEVVLVGDHEVDARCAENAGIAFINAEKLIKIDV